jgi:hypothetical protein
VTEEKREALLIALQKVVLQLYQNREKIADTSSEKVPAIYLLCYWKIPKLVKSGKLS